MSQPPGKPLSIGRAGLNPQIVAVSEVGFDDDRGVSLEGWLRGAESLDELTACRDQLLGLAGNADEPVVPVVCAADPSLDGFYRVRSVSVGTEPRMRLDSGSVLPWSAGLERVSSFASPVFDTRLLHAVRSGSAVTSASSDPLHGVPQTTTRYQWSTLGVWGLLERAIPGGVVLWTRRAGNDSQANAEWQAPPQGFYAGAATLSHYDGNSAGAAIVGKQTDLDPNQGWLLSNGLVAVVPSEAVGGSSGRITLYGWSGTGWESPMPLTFDLVSGGDPVDVFSSVTVLRNSPEAVTIRLNAAITTATPTATIDLTVRRGDRMAQGVVRTSTNATALVVSVFGSFGTSVTGGRTTNADDADGNRPVITTALGSPGSGGVTGPAPGVVDFGFGHVIGGASADSENTAQALANQYAAYVSERVLVANP